MNLECSVCLYLAVGVNFGFSLYSIGWLRLLHHCLTHVSDLEAMMASAAAPTANLLQTCAALLMSPYCGMHSPNIEAVLVKIGLQSTRIGLKLIDILLRNCAASGTDPASELLTAASLLRFDCMSFTKHQNPKSSSLYYFEDNLKDEQGHILDVVLLYQLVFLLTLMNLFLLPLSACHVIDVNVLLCYYPIRLVFHILIFMILPAPYCLSQSF